MQHTTARSWKNLYEVCEKIASKEVEILNAETANLVRTVMLFCIQLVHSPVCLSKVQGSECLPELTVSGVSYVFTAGERNATTRASEISTIINTFNCVGMF
jgi:hypothetical protein